jgi:hypothetical protein
LALWADRTLASFAFGAAAAWAYSTFQETRAVRSAYLWQYAWLQEEVTVVAEEEGLRLSNARGSSFLRWDGGISVHSQPGFFLIKDEHEDLAYFPKKYLSDRELLALNRHASQQRPSVTGAPAKHRNQADEARDR